MLRRYSLVNIIPLAGYTIVFLTAVLTIASIYRPTVIEKLAPDKYDLYLISAYYYSVSNSLGNNSVAFVWTADYDVIENMGNLWITSENLTNSVTSAANLQPISPHKTCRWISIFATTHVVPNMNKLYLYMGKRRVQIPFKQAVQQKHEVVACMTPLVASEEWRKLIVALHIYKKFGAFVHVYVRSVVSSMMDLMRLYEKEDYLTIESWAKLSLSTIETTSFDPNLNVELLNEASAQTDCLLKYKESAKFIIFTSVEHVVLPHSASDFLSDFNQIFLHSHNLAFIRHSSNKININTGSSAEFSFSSSRISEVSTDSHDNSLVIQTQKVNHTWIMWPFNGQKQYISPSKSFFDRLKFANSRRYMNKQTLSELQKDFQIMMSMDSASEIMSRMPKTSVYGQYLKECYSKYDIYNHINNYGTWRPKRCPSIELCANEMPDVSIECSNAKADYQSISGDQFDLHYHQNIEFETGLGCRL